MLLKNLNVKEGLVNGLRLKTVKLMNNSIEAISVSGQTKGRKFVLPRIKNIYRSNDMPFTFHRTQFPISLSYAITIN